MSDPNVSPRVSEVPKRPRVLEFDFIRCAACLAVVLMHSAGGYFLNEPTDSLAWNLSGALNACTRLCVPLFVMISGYFLLSRPCSSENLTRFYQKRAKTILIPTLFWSAFYIAVGLIAYPKSAVTFAVLGVLNGRTALCSHLWYLFMIMGLYFVAPFLSNLFQQFSRRQIFYATLVFALLNMANVVSLRFIVGPLLEPNNIFSIRFIASPSTTSSSIFTLFTQYVPYFVFGKLLGDYALSIKSSRCAFFSLIGYVVSSVCIYLSFRYSTEKDYFWATANAASPFVIAQTISFYLFALTWRSNPFLKLPTVVERVAALSFGIYLAHRFYTVVLPPALGVVGLAPDPSRPAFTLIVNLAAVYAFTFVTVFVLSKTPYLRRVI